MKKKLVIAALILVLCGAMVFAAGGSQSASGKPTLIWWFIGGTPNNITEGLKAISDYTESKIGVRVDLKFSGWGEAGQRFQTIVNSGEYFDLMFTDTGTYGNFVNLGAFADITDMLNSTPALKNFIPNGLWDGVRVNGRIYSVPTYKDSSKTDYFVWDDTYLRKYSIDPTKVHTFAELDAAFRKMKSGEGQRFYPLLLSQSSLFSSWTYSDFYDDLSLGLPTLGVGFTDNSRKVVSVFEQPEVMDKLRYLNRWYKDGIINPDAPVVQETPKQLPFFVGQGWPSAAVTWQINNGVQKYVLEKVFGPLYSTGTIQGSLNAISANSRYKNEALKLIELVNTDRKMRDMMGYGIEGVNFTYVKPTVVHLINDQWNPARYQQGSFFTMSDMEGSEGQWNEVRQQNEQASQSVLNGFLFDSRSVMNEVTNCKTVVSKYQNELLTGASDPDVAVPAMMRDLNAAGFQRIMQEAQRQVDAFKR